MKLEELVATIEHTLTKNQVMNLAATTSEAFDVKELIDLTYHQNEQVAFRAAWILENIYIHHLDTFISSAIYFLDNFCAQKNLSCRRHFTKIVALMTDKKASPLVKEMMKQYESDSLVELVFEWLIDEKVPVAVKSHCLNILANLSLKHPWLSEELTATMDFLVDKESIAFYAKVKQIRKQLSTKPN